MDGLSNQAKKFYRKHASTVLTIAGGGEELTKMEKFKIVGSNYVPSILIGSATLACIFGDNFRTRVATKDANFVFG